MSIHFEPADPIEPTVTLVSRSLFDRLGHCLGAVVGKDEVSPWCEFNGRLYRTTEPDDATHSDGADLIAAKFRAAVSAS